MEDPFRGKEENRKMPLRSSENWCKEFTTPPETMMLKVILAAITLGTRDFLRLPELKKACAMPGEINVMAV